MCLLITTKNGRLVIRNGDSLDELRKLAEAPYCILKGPAAIVEAANVDMPGEWTAVMDVPDTN